MNQDQNETTAESVDVMDICRVGDHVDLRLDEGVEGTKMAVVAIEEFDIGRADDVCKVYPSFDVYKVVRPGVHRRVTLMEIVHREPPDSELQDSDESL